MRQLRAIDQDHVDLGGKPVKLRQMLLSCNTRVALGSTQHSQICQQQEQHLMTVPSRRREADKPVQRQSHLTVAGCLFWMLTNA